jgi:hypothetical protein
MKPPQVPRPGPSTGGFNPLLTIKGQRSQGPDAPPPAKRVLYERPLGFGHHRTLQCAQSACAAFGIAACLFSGAARSQDTGPDDLGLKGTQEPQSAATTSGDGTSETVPASPKPKPATGKTALPRLQPYQGAQRLDQRGGPRVGEKARPRLRPSRPCPRRRSNGPSGTKGRSIRSASESAA